MKGVARTRRVAGHGYAHGPPAQSPPPRCLKSGRCRSSPGRAYRAGWASCAPADGEAPPGPAPASTIAPAKIEDKGGERVVLVQHVPAQGTNWAARGWRKRAHDAPGEPEQERQEDERVDHPPGRGTRAHSLRCKKPVQDKRLDHGKCPGREQRSEDRAQSAAQAGAPEGHRAGNADNEKAPARPGRHSPPRVHAEGGGMAGHAHYALLGKPHGRRAHLVAGVVAARAGIGRDRPRPADGLWSCRLRASPWPSPARRPRAGWASCLACGRAWQLTPTCRSPAMDSSVQPHVALGAVPPLPPARGGKLSAFFVAVQAGPGRRAGPWTDAWGRNGTRRPACCRMRGIPGRAPFAWCFPFLPPSSGETWQR